MEQTHKGRVTKINWDQMELDWRLGVLTCRAMRDKYGAGGYGDTDGGTVSHTAITAHFKHRGIPRDQGGKAKRTQWREAMPPEVVGRALVAASHALDEGKALTGAQLAIATDAVLTAGALISHRSDIKAARDINVALFKELATAMTDTATGISSPLLTLASVCKTLTDSLAKLIALERQAYNVPDIAPEVAPTPAQAELSHDTARRFAFVLMQAAKAKAVSG